MQITSTPSPATNFHRGRQSSGEGSHKVTHICLMAQVFGMAKAAELDYLTPGSRKSVHYLVRTDGEINQFVNESDSAMHTPNAHNTKLPLPYGVNPNAYTVAIDHECNAGDPGETAWPEAQGFASATLIAEICQRHDIPIDRNHILLQSDFNPGLHTPHIPIEELISGALIISQEKKAHHASSAAATTALTAEPVDTGNAEAPAESTETAETAETAEPITA